MVSDTTGTCSSMSLEGILADAGYQVGGRHTSANDRSLVVGYEVQMCYFLGGGNKRRASIADEGKCKPGKSVLGGPQVSDKLPWNLNELHSLHYKNCHVSTPALDVLRTSPGFLTPGSQDQDVQPLEGCSEGQNRGLEVPATPPEGTIDAVFNAHRSPQDLNSTSPSNRVQDISTSGLRL